MSERLHRAVAFGFLIVWADQSRLVGHTDLFEGPSHAQVADQAYLFGAKVQYGKGKNHFKVYSNYREVEDNAVIGVFTDSDFRGGGTDGNGLEVGAGYGITDKVTLGLTYFINNRGIDEEVEYKRFQADLAMKF